MLLLRWALLLGCLVSLCSSAAQNGAQWSKRLLRMDERKRPLDPRLRNQVRNEVKEIMQDDPEDLIDVIQDAAGNRDAERRSATKPTPKPPTKEPTTTPTKPPTDAPTVKPTKEPTEQPTEKATKAPTEQPTTKAPTERPTTAPTPLPTQPTREPTPAPTAPPTKDPTCFPTSFPTAAPTMLPTRATPCPTLPPTPCPTPCQTLLPTPFPSSVATPPCTLPTSGSTTGSTLNVTEAVNVSSAQSPGMRPLSTDSLMNETVALSPKPPSNSSSIPSTSSHSSYDCEPEGASALSSSARRGDQAILISASADFEDGDFLKIGDEECECASGVARRSGQQSLKLSKPLLADHLNGVSVVKQKVTALKWAHPQWTGFLKLAPSGRFSLRNVSAAENGNGTSFALTGNGTSPAAESGTRSAAGYWSVTGNGTSLALDWDSGPVEVLSGTGGTDFLDADGSRLVADAALPSLLSSPLHT